MTNGPPISHPQIPNPVAWVSRYVEALSGGTALPSNILHRPSSPDGSVIPDSEVISSMTVTSPPPLEIRNSHFVKAPDSHGSVTSYTANNQSASGGLESYRASPHLQTEGRDLGVYSLPLDTEYLGLRYPDFRKRPKLKPRVDIGAWEAPAAKVATDARDYPADSASWGGASLGGAAVQWAPTSGGGMKKKKKKARAPMYFSSLPPHHSRPSRRHPRPSQRAWPCGAPAADHSASNIEAEGRESNKESEEQDGGEDELGF